VKLGVMVEPTLEATSSQGERLAVDPWGFLLFQVKLRIHLGRTWRGVIILERCLLSRPILSRVQMSIPNSLIPVVMGLWNRYHLELTVLFHCHI
jgi:hypothetical protein